MQPTRQRNSGWRLEFLVFDEELWIALHIVEDDVDGRIIDIVDASVVQGPVRQLPVQGRRSAVLRVSEC